MNIPAPRVVYADEAILVVDKPSGLPSVPARTPLDPPAVARMLAAEFGPLEAVHRLDRDTSGLLVFARGPGPRALLGRAFERSLVEKRYLAIVAGRPPAAQGEVHLPLAGDRDRPPRQRVDHVFGRRAATAWRILATQRDPAGISASLLEIRPLTGRSHQIRVHLLWLGCPIIGDRLYGPGAVHQGTLGLHAAGLAFDHPLTGRRFELTSAPPQAAPWDMFTTELTAASV